MQTQHLSVSQFLSDPRSDEHFTPVLLVDSRQSTAETLRVALPETCSSCGNWFELPASAVESVIPLGGQECCQEYFRKAALLIKPDQTQLIEMLRLHFSRGGESTFEAVGQSSEVCQADEEQGFEAADGAGGELSGAAWVAKFPTSRSLLDLKPPFLPKMSRFHNALLEAGAAVKVSATLRPPERAYLMHWSSKIARKEVDPQQVPAMPGVDIRWWHGDPGASLAAAQKMVSAFGIAFPPALTSNHIRGLAIDMTIAWSGTLGIQDATGNRINIGAPRSGGNSLLHQVGRSYGVIKLVSDPPHWSDNGR